jgi:hypothetical protein
MDFWKTKAAGVKNSIDPDKIEPLVDPKTAAQGIPEE